MSVMSYMQRQQQLLRMEYEYEKEEFREHTRITGIAAAVRRGRCWYPVNVGRNYYNSLNQLVIEINRSSDEVEVDHEFEYGRQVTFFTEGGDGSVNYLNINAAVSYVDGSRMVVVMPGAAAVALIEGSERLGVQLAFDETSYRAMFDALDAVMRAKGNRLAELRDILVGDVRPRRRQLPQVVMPWLNSSQQEAVNSVLACRDVAVVHGPPGTGKTTTLVEAIYETLHREPQVLVCAQSNIAVDWICEKLVDRGVSVLRIGNPSRVNDKMLSFTYEKRFEGHSSYPELWSLRQEMRRLRSGGRRKSHQERESLRNRLDRLRGRADELEIAINADLFNSANVVASTLVGSSHRLLYRQHYSTLFIDEAAQALEAACWIAVQKASRVVLAGDHCQLPATVKCHDAACRGLARPLMANVVESHPGAVSLLTVQYRMSRRIMQFPSDWFYHGLLTAAPEVEFRGILDMDRAIEWIDTSGMDFKEEYVGDVSGRINRDEARLLVNELERYVDRIGMQRLLDERVDFGVISPYKAQVRYLRGCIKRSQRLRPLRELISVNTVDGFQGQERDAVFISLVRANDRGRIGFLGDLRRMNVAMTRARMKLVILGDASTLGRHPFYARLLEYIRNT